MTHPWGERYIYLDGCIKNQPFHVGKYTSPMNGMGNFPLFLFFPFSLGFSPRCVCFWKKTLQMEASRCWISKHLCHLVWWKVEAVEVTTKKITSYHGWSTYLSRATYLFPPRNIALIAGLKGNEWFLISPDHSRPSGRGYVHQPQLGGSGIPDPVVRITPLPKPPWMEGIPTFIPGIEDNTRSHHGQMKTTG